jgi:hypothetical protein
MESRLGGIQPADPVQERRLLRHQVQTVIKDVTTQFLCAKERLLMRHFLQGAAQFAVKVLGG